jgi:hypothetical protein
MVVRQVIRFFWGMFEKYTKTRIEHLVGDDKHNKDIMKFHKILFIKYSKSWLESILLAQVEYLIGNENNMHLVTSNLKCWKFIESYCMNIQEIHKNTPKR